VLNSFLKVKGTFETSTNATVYSPPTLLLHFRLQSVQLKAHFTIVQELLAEYHIHSKNLNVIDIPFNIGDDEELDKWNTFAEELAAELFGFKHVIVFVTTHSDPNTGDLWRGQDKNNNPWAEEVNEVSTSLLYNFILILTIN
jgi:hypothetical protein